MIRYKLNSKSSAHFRTSLSAPLWVAAGSVLHKKSDYEFDSIKGASQAIRRKVTRLSLKQHTRPTNVPIDFFATIRKRSFRIDLSPQTGFAPAAQLLIVLIGIGVYITMIVTMIVDTSRHQPTEIQL